MSGKNIDMSDEVTTKDMTDREEETKLSDEFADVTGEEKAPEPKETRPAVQYPQAPVRHCFDGPF